MLEWFTEDAFFPACIGILLTIAFLGLAFSSGEKVMFKAGLAIAALTALLITTEVLIVTDREEIENSIYEMAAAMQQNDFEKVFDYLDTEELKRRAKGELRDATCHACSITAINEVTVKQEDNTAVADFVGFAQASNRAFPSPTPIQRRIKLYFRKAGDDWKIIDFESSDPRAGFSL